jgi:antibiotic biosynthesis monooxygenase (ABM) superfamily enzyme
MPSVRSTPPTVAGPSIHLRAAFTWLAVYFMIMATQTLLGPLLGSLSLPLRTLVVTGVVVPTVVYALVPAILRTYGALRPHGTRRGVKRTKGMWRPTWR